MQLDTTREISRVCAILNSNRCANHNTTGSATGDTSCVTLVLQNVLQSLLEYTSFKF